MDTISELKALIEVKNALIEAQATTIRKLHEYVIQVQLKALVHEESLLNRVLAKPETDVTDEEVEEYERQLNETRQSSASQLDATSQDYDEDALNDALVALGWTEQ